MPFKNRQKITGKKLEDRCFEIYLETSWAPVDKLDSSLSFDVSNGSIDVLWNDITTEEETASHVFTLSFGQFKIKYGLVLTLKTRYYKSMLIIYHDVGRIWPSGWLVRSRHWWFQRRKVVRGKPFLQRWLVRRWREGSEYVGMGPS